MEELTDEQLIDEVRQGHAEAYRFLIERHQRYIYTLVYRIVGHKETAEDLTQDVFVKLFRSLSHFRGDAKFTTWLYRMTMNLVTDYKRAQKRRPYVALLDKMKGWFGEPSEQPEEALLRRDEQQRMQELLVQLPDKYRLVLYLHHYNQLSYHEMSAVTGLPLKTLETRLYRGKALLKRKWLEVNANERQSAGGRAPQPVPE